MPIGTKGGNWLQTALRFRGSVIPAVLPRIIACGLFGEAIFFLETFLQVDLSPEILGNLGFVLNLVLSLLLVFRTNTAYERFWEGRKAWGTLVNTVRNCARTIWVAISEKRPEDKAQKIAALRYLLAFAVAMKLHLRHQPVNHEIKALVSSSQFEQLLLMNHPPLEIAFWLVDYAQRQHDRGCLSIYLLNLVHQQVSIMVDVLGVCERIQKTPIPIAYSIHLKQILLVYCLFLPFQIVDEFGWFTGFFAAMMSFVLLGIEEIGLEIEDPFGTDPNDLPLEIICQTMQRNIDDLIKLSPSVRQYSAGEF